MLKAEETVAWSARVGQPGAPLSNRSHGIYFSRRREIVAVLHTNSERRARPRWVTLH